MHAVRESAGFSTKLKAELYSFSSQILNGAFDHTAAEQREAHHSPLRILAL